MDPRDPNNFWAVFNLINVSWAIGAGFSFGATILAWFQLKYPRAAYIRPSRVFLLTTFVSLVTTTVFWASQLVEAVMIGDTQVYRILARYLLMCLFFVAMSFGLALSLKFAVYSPNTPPLPSNHQDLKNGRKEDNGPRD